MMSVENQSEPALKELSADAKAKAAEELLTNIKRQLPNLEKMLHNVEEHWSFEDGFYRFLPSVV